MNNVCFHELGLIDYKEAWDYQEKLFQEIVSQKIQNRDLALIDQTPTQSHFISCQHPHVYTLGKSGEEQHLLLNEAGLKDKSAVFYKINRGGDITYHGPGQLVGYPILDLDNFFTDIHKYLRFLEETIILTMAYYGLKGERYPGYTGVWMDPQDPLRARKICAIGVRTSRWVTMHGFAFNVHTDLSYFGNIIPCGITDKAVTSLEKELGRIPDMQEVTRELKKNFAALFACELTSAQTGIQ
ncbi:MAG TPA: lipoyl(octanoyl) transferase LipB [Bacteroidia bacterium]|jgi:lipoyl(octanoyl) transferase|nr:lipoyl(octanoyl) transferase LipB [Bacteroidia bacterium]